MLNLTTRSVSRNEAVFRHNQPWDMVYIVKSGELSLRLPLPVLYPAEPDVEVCTVCPQLFALNCLPST